MRITRMGIAAFVLAASLPVSAFAVDAELQKKIDDLSQQLESLKQQVQKSEEKAKVTEEKVEKTEALAKQTDEKSLGKWLTIGGDYRFRVDSLRGDVAPYANAMTFGTYVQNSMKQLYNDTYNLMFNGAVATATNGLRPPTQTEFMAAQQQAGAAATTAQNQAMQQALTNPALMAQFLAQSKAMQDAYKTKNNTLYTNRVGLNIKAKATENVTFKSRLLMYKVAGAQYDSSTIGPYFSDRAGIFDGTLGHVPSDGQLTVDQAYVTWSNIAEQPLWFSVGRRPSTDGSPLHLKNNTEKTGTAGLPALLVNYAFDGMTIGYAPDVDALGSPYVKLCYGRGFESGFSGSPAGNSLKDTDMLGVQAAVYNTDDVTALIQYNRGFNIFDAPVFMTGPFNTLSVGPSVNLGDIDWYGFDVVGKTDKVGPGVFNWFLDGALSVTHPNHDTSAQFGGMGMLSGGFMDPDMNPSSKTGWAVFVGGRYDVTATKTKLGFEYNHGSKNWIAFAPSADDMWTSKLGTRGNAYEGYVIQELNLKPISSLLSKVFFKVGYQYYDFEYTGSNNWVGAPVKISDLNSASLQLMAPIKNAQDIYGTFEVQF